MTAGRTWAVAARVLLQLRRDPRTLALLVVVPTALMALLAWIFSDQDERFDQIAPSLLAVFPFTVMFLVTSVTTLRERVNGTLERLLALPLGRVDFLLGYAAAFAVAALVQTVVAVTVSVTFLGLDYSGSLPLLLTVTAADAVLGAALGLFVSAFAASEFQAVQFMPVVVIPQLLLCGLCLPRANLPGPLDKLSETLPLTYAVEAIKHLGLPNGDAAALNDLSVVVAFAVGVLVLGSATLRRQTR